ncbi:asparaginase domain-containing protein [Agrobacterium larrymoorei]|uniref:Asparaginase domain-containing protein n=1 Tax=Agrobacterium larrymoorei TaxID=160699 RepID=A0AAF0HEG3_9HYPH|nr:asparaginase domain-containing protein [Agrobacterium larrymoorei]WHA43035.1 asparaginase domain-containing protein [Agrobacterium larrymoorei]
MNQADHIDKADKLVAVIATGGTIASMRDESGAAKPSLTGENLLSGLSADHIALKPVELMAKDSSSLTISDMQMISNAVASELADPEISGVVVLHGTDAMEETSLLVHLQHRLKKPVVFTGAQFTADNPQADGPENLRAAIAAAANQDNAEKGVLLGFGGKLLPVWGLYKRSADERDAFELAGPAAIATSPEMSAAVDAIRVDIVAIHPGCEATHIDASLNAGARGIVLSALGSGNANARVVQAVKRCAEKGVPVVVSSRVPVGRLVAGYGGGGGGHDMGEVGAVHSRTLRPGQARILLASLIASSAGREEIERAFNDFAL